MGDEWPHWLTGAIVWVGKNESNTKTENLGVIGKIIVGANGGVKDDRVGANGGVKLRQCAAALKRLSCY